jgi:hypothetical protein
MDGHFEIENFGTLMVNRKMKIILDCELMKHPNSGLYHYCLNLGLSVKSQLKEAGTGTI